MENFTTGCLSGDSSFIHLLAQSRNMFKSIQYPVPLKHSPKSVRILYFLLILPSTTLTCTWITGVKHHLMQHKLLLSWIKLTLTLTRIQKLSFWWHSRNPPLLAVLLKLDRLRSIISHKTVAKWHWPKLPVPIFSLFNYFLVNAEQVSCYFDFLPM